MFWVLWSESVWTSNLNGQKIEVFSQGTEDSKNFKCETLYIGDYEYVNIFSFAVLGIKLWMEEDGNLNRNDPFYSFSRKRKIDTKMLSSFSNNFISNKANLKIFAYL